MVYLPHRSANTEPEYIAAINNDGKTRNDIILKVAQQLVHRILDESIDVIKVFYGIDHLKPSQLLVYDPNDPRFDEVLERQNESMQIRAIPLLNAYIRQWSLKQYKWKWLVQPYQNWKSHSDGHHIFIFQAIFSMPTKHNPLPLATASVFFVFRVPEIDSNAITKPIYISYRYQFEGMTFFHEPIGRQLDFQEGMLLEIVESKLKLYKMLDF